MSDGKIDPVLNQHIQHEQSDQRQRERQELTRRILRGEAPWRDHEGIMGVVTAARDLEFPCSFDDIREAAGDRDVVTTSGIVHSLEDVLDVLEPRLTPGKDPLLEDWRVPSYRDFHEIVQRHWEAVRFEDVPEEQRPARGGPGPQNPRSRG